MFISPNPGLAPSIGLFGHQGMHMVHMDKSSQSNHTYKIKINIYFKKNISLLSHLIGLEVVKEQRNINQRKETHLLTF